MGRTVAIPVPEVFEPLLAPSRYKGIYGGRGGAKSHAFADLAVDECLRRRGLRFVCIREVQRSLEMSVKRLIEDKIQTYGLGREFRVLNTHIETPGDGVMIFNGMQDHTAESIKSLEGFDRAWVEEAQSLSRRSLNLLRPTMFRRPNSEIWFSWNPRYESDPVDDFFRGNRPRRPEEPRWQPPPDAIVVRSSYRDNPWLLPDLLKEIEWDRASDPEKYAHVWLGEYERHSENRVFKNWRVEEFDTPSDATFYFGGDWGFSVDPTVLVRLWAKHPKTLYIDREAYKVGCEIDHTVALFDSIENGMARNWTIVADSARPETISYLQRHGYPKIRPATKGPNSVKEGVIFLQGFEIVIHPRCVHTIDEFTMYSYKRDPMTDDVTPVLEDKKNHVIDSVRYAVEKLREASMTLQVVRARGY
jgi:phage terminase large subunit